MEYKIKPKIDSCHNNYFKNIFLQQNVSIFSYQIQIFSQESDLDTIPLHNISIIGTP